MSSPRSITCACFLLLALAGQSNEVQGQPILAASWSDTDFPGVPPRITPGVPVDIFIVALDLPPIEAYEFGVYLPPCFDFSEPELLTPGLNFGDSSLRPNLLVGTAHVHVSGALVPLVRVLLTPTQDCSGQIIVGPASPSSFDPAQPGYLVADAPGDLRPFTVGPPLIVGIPGNTILFFGADPNPFPLGEAVSLTWQLPFEVDTLVLEPGPGSLDPATIQHTVFPAGTETYTLTVEVDGETDSADLIVALQEPSVVFTAAPEQIFPGEIATLQWEVISANQIAIDEGIGSVAASGSVEVTPIATTTYSLTATNPEASTTEDVVVTVLPPQASLSVSDAAPFGGEIITLTAFIAGAESATIEPGIGSIDPAGGQFQVTAEEAVTFTLNAVNAAGTTTRSVSVAPRAPEVALTASNTRPIFNEPFELIAMVMGAASATLEPGFGTIDPSGGTFTTSTNITRTYTLSATNPAGTSSVSVTVDPVSAPPLILTPSWSGTSIVAVPPTPLVLGTEFDLFVVASGLRVQMRSYELQVQLPPCVEIVGVESPGTDGDPDLLDLAVDVSDLGWDATFFQLARLRLLVTNPNCMGNVELAAADPSTFVPAAAGYRFLGEGGQESEEAFAVATAFPLTIGSPADPGDVGIFFDPEATESTTELFSFVPFDFYVASVQISPGQEGYEFSVDVDPRVTIFEETIYPEGTATDFGVDAGNFKNYLVGTGGTCLFGVTTILVQLEALLFAAADDVLFCMGAASPSSFSPERPGFLSCDGHLLPYGAAYEGCAVGNPRTVPIPTGLVCDPPQLSSEQVTTLSWDPTTGQWRARITLRNAGPGVVHNVSAELAATATVNPISAASHYGTLAADESAAGDPFLLQAAPAPDPPGLDGSLRVRFEDGCGEAHHTTLRTSLSTVSLPERLGLGPNYPNPFNPRTVIPFTLREDGHARLEVFDVKGRLLRVLVDEHLYAGSRSVEWDGTDAKGRPVTAGIFWYRLQQGGQEQTRAMVLVR